MFEYMASKRPLIASDLPSIKGVLNNKNSILIKPGSVEELTAGVKKIIIKKELGEEIAAQANKDVQEHTWQKRAKRIINII